ncbi:MAG: N-acetyl-gamma-glutamyl-phosphate reductase [Candidatus Omnitrophica bacterium]|nr:N-acetyl-gamma-glutamyl-phosphate reductase [Candidatus Omnitrophota bacterium]
MPVNVSIIGATGYTGQQLLEILLAHPKVTVTALYSTTDEPKPISELVSRFYQRTSLVCQKLNISDVISRSDFIFLALPHTQAMEIVPQLLAANKYVVDLSADYRLNNPKTYQLAYGLGHKDPANIKKAIYGLCELYRLKIQNAKFVANPGCYPTAAVLGLAPLVATDSLEDEPIIIDAKSGTSGAGKKLAPEMLFTEIDEDFHAYKVNSHQHIPEIEQELTKLAGKKIPITFVPHLLPVKRGILSTMYVRLKTKSYTTPKLISLYKKFYQKEPFIRIRDNKQVCLKDVCYTNFCDISVQVFDRTVIVITAIDNLIKGASGQAVQNMNIMLGYPQTTGLL